MSVLEYDGDQVGKRVPQLDSIEKTSGRAKYIADLYQPGMLHGAVLQSPYAHARILRYDLSEALALPGVHAIVTGDDMQQHHRMGAFIKDEHAIAKEKVRYVGEAVAAVAADTVAIARQAVQLISIDYEELPAILNIEDARAPGAPLIHEDYASFVKVFDTGTEGNLCARTSFSEGDIEQGWAESDLIFENNYETQAQAHLSIEPCGALAEVDASGRVTLWSANQSVFRVQAGVCESLGLTMSRVRCLTPKIGAGFGNKMEAHIQPIVVMLALKAKRPVKMILTREQDFEMVRARHPYRIRVKTGVKKDGRLVAREVEVLLDGGAFADDSPGVLGYSLLMGCGPYRIPHAHCHGRLFYTNKLRFGAMRGFGVPQLSFATETQLDEIADALSMDPFELRRMNLKQDGDAWFGGQQVLSNGLAQCMEQVRIASNWSSPRLLPTAAGKRRALGMACTAHISGLLSTGAIIRLLEDGTIVLNTGSVDIGQGSSTILSQMCADALKIPLDHVSVASPDTDGSPYNWGTTASRVTYMTGRSVVGAAAEVESKIKQQAAAMLEAEPADLELGPGGKVVVKGDPSRSVSFADVSARAHWVAGGPIIGTHSWVFDQPTIDPKRAVAIGNPFRYIGIFTFNAMVVDVEIDESTGSSRVLKAWSACDVGRAINPQLVEGQIEGAFVQGMGYALVEEMVWDGARLANPTLMDYKIPTFCEAPAELHAIIVESHEPDGPFGAKSAGEIGINGVAAAIGNAISTAAEMRLRQLPLTPERVLRGMLAAQEENHAA
jgi:CO/xanthine dehydrogenase Mo-binding subunit